MIAELCPFENSVNFSFPANLAYNLHPIKLKLCKYLHYGVEHCILFRGYSTPNITRVMPLKNFHKIFIYGELRLQFTSNQAENWFFVRPWCGAVHIILRLQFTKY